MEKLKTSEVNRVGGGDNCNPIILFGTGNLAELFYKKNKKLVDIKFCLDNDKNKQGKEFHNSKIYSPYDKNINIKDCRIIIASMYYSEISSQLKEMGLCEIEDFIPYNLFNKKIAIIYGNCHTRIIKNYLKSSCKFSSIYEFYNYKPVYDFKFGSYLEESILRNCDLFIYQYISKEYRDYKFSTDYILTQLSKDCKKINIPNLFGFGKMFFPQATSNLYNKAYKSDSNGLFPHGDENIIKFIENNISINEIIHNLNKKIYSKNYILLNFNIVFKKLIDKEKYWDIKISRFIKKNYKRKLLFYDPGHPTNYLLKKIAKEILKILNIHDKIRMTDSINLDGLQIPIYPCVRKCLKLKFKTKKLRCTFPVEEFRYKKLTFEDYIREYISWCYDMKDSEN